MEIKSSNGMSTYWVPDLVMDPQLYTRLRVPIPEDKLVAGDIVPFGTRCQVVLNTWFNGRDNWIRYQDTMSSGSGRVWEEIASPTCMLEDVFRTRGATALPPSGFTSQTLARKKVADMWNGTCPRCGKGTYTGAWQVEHDGPCR